MARSRFRPIEIFLIPFTMLWFLGVLTFTVVVWATGFPWPFKLFSLFFLALGCYFAFGRFLVEKQIKKNLRYSVTDARVLIQRVGKTGERAVNLSQLVSLELDEMPDGSGTIRFPSASTAINVQNFGFWQPSLDATPQFIGIENVRSVYQIIQSQMDS